MVLLSGKNPSSNQSLQQVIDVNDDLNSHTPLSNQVIKYNGTNVVWGDVSSSVIPTLQQVLTQGNTASTNIIITGPRTTTMTNNGISINGQTTYSHTGANIRDIIKIETINNTSISLSGNKGSAGNALVSGGPFGNLSWAPIGGLQSLQSVIDVNDDLSGNTPSSGQLIQYDGTNVVWGDVSTPTLQSVLNAGNTAIQTITLFDNLTKTTSISDSALSISNIISSTDNTEINISDTLITLNNIASTSGEGSITMQTIPGGTNFITASSVGLPIDGTSGTISISATPTNPVFQLSQSNTVIDETHLLVILKDSITHDCSGVTGPFTISTNTDLTLTSTQNINLDTSGQVFINGTAYPSIPTLQAVIDAGDDLSGNPPGTGQVIQYDGTNVVWGDVSIPTLQNVLDTGNSAISQSIILVNNFNTSTLSDTLSISYLDSFNNTKTNTISNSAILVNTSDPLVGDGSVQMSSNPGSTNGVTASSIGFNSNPSATISMTTTPTDPFFELSQVDSLNSEYSLVISKDSITHDCSGVTGPFTISTNIDLNLASTQNINLDASGQVFINGTAYPPPLSSVLGSSSIGNAGQTITLTSSSASSYTFLDSSGTHVTNGASQADLYSGSLEIKDTTESFIATRSSTTLTNIPNQTTNASTPTGITITDGSENNVGLFTNSLLQFTDVSGALLYQGVKLSPTELTGYTDLDDPYKPIFTIKNEGTLDLRSDNSIQLYSAKQVNINVGTQMNITGRDINIKNDASLPLYITNTSGTGIPSKLSLKKITKLGQPGDVFATINYEANDASGNNKVFASQNAVIKTATGGAEDASIDFYVKKNGSDTKAFTIDGGEEQINFNLDLDMNSKNITTSSGNLTLTTAGATGATGVITFNSKTQSPTTTADTVFQTNTVNTLTHSDASGWDFQANNITTTGDISCNTLYYTSLSPGPSLQNVMDVSYNLNSVAPTFSQVIQFDGTNPVWASVPPISTDTLQQVLTAGNVTDKQIRFMTDPLISEMTLNTSTELLKNYTNFTAVGSYPSSSKTTYITNQFVKEQMYINGAGVYNVATLEISGNPIDSISDLKSQVSLLEQNDATGKNVTTTYRPIGITQTNDASANVHSNFTVTTDSKFLVNSDNLTVSDGSIAITSPTANLSITTSSIQYTNSVPTAPLFISSANDLTILADNIDLSNLRLTMPSLASSSYMDFNSATGKMALLNSNAGGSASPQLTLTNTNATGSVALEVYKNKPTAGANGDVLFNQSVFGKDSGNVKQEYTRISHTIRDATAGAEDGSIEMGCFVNGAYQNFVQFNANDAPIGEVNVFRPLDFIGGSDANNTIKVSGTGSQDLNLTGVSSAGTGHINLTSKTGSVLNVAGNININAVTSTGAGTVNITAKTGANINLNSNVLMDNSETLTIRNNTGLISNSQSSSQIGFTDLTDGTNVKQHIISNTQQQISLQQSAFTYFNEGTSNNVILREADTTGQDTQRTTLTRNLLEIRDIAFSGIFSQLSYNNLTIHAPYSPDPVQTGYNAITAEAQGTNSGTSYISLGSGENNTGSGRRQQTQITNGDQGGGFNLNWWDPSNLMKSFRMFLQGVGGGFLQFDNSIDANPLTIQSVKTNLKLQTDSSTAGQGDIEFAPSQSANGQIIITGASLQDTTSSGSAHKYLKIVLNGASYKIALDNN